MVETITIGCSMLSIHFVMRIISIVSIEHNQTLFLLYTHLQSYKSPDMCMLQIICQLYKSFMIFVSLYNIQFSNLHNFGNISFYIRCTTWYKMFKFIFDWKYCGYKIQSSNVFGSVSYAKSIKVSLVLLGSFCTTSIIAYVPHLLFMAIHFELFPWSKTDEYGKDRINRICIKTYKKDRKETEPKAQLSLTLSWKVRISLRQINNQ